MADPVTFTVYCPRCDRPYSSTKSHDAAMEIVKEHVSKQHPDHDPEWYDTYPSTEP